MKSTLAASVIAAAVASEVEVESKCKGTADPSGPRCFQGSAGALGVTESIHVSLDEVGVGSGVVTFTGAGIEGFTCSSKSYTHNGLDLEFEDLSDCLPDLVALKSLQYCSDSDEVHVSVKVSVVPLPIKATLSRVACDGEKFEEWKAAYGSNGGEDEFAVFSSNLRTIMEMQANDPSGTYSHMSPFANISPEIFKSRNGYRKNVEATQGPLLDVSNVADSWDWRDHGAVNPIKDQGQCGSCWAFSTVANIEGVGAVETSKLLSLSEQQLVDCDTADGGCNGGLPSNAFQFMIDHGMGLESESQYPYTAADGTCHKSDAQEKAFITAWHQTSTDETQIAAALQQYGPLSIGINANTLQFYTGGVANPFLCNPAALDHGVAIVGFGTDNGQDYWTIRNSWGTGWGEAGYFRMARGKGKCGLNTDVTTATGVSTQALRESNSTRCIKPGSIPGGSCQPCKETAQCSSGFCCPFMKKCVSSSTQGCSYPIANCRPTCFSASCGTCSPSDGSNYNSGWGSPTCASEEVVV